MGHIEDIAVDKNQQGKKLGLRIIEALVHISESCGCYKTILDCSDSNVREFLVSFFTCWTCQTVSQHFTKNVDLRKWETKWFVFCLLVFAQASKLTFDRRTGKIC